MFVHHLVGVYRNKTLHTYILLILFIALTLLALFLTSIHPTHVQISGMGGTTQITLPLEEHSDLPGQGTKEYDLTGNLSSSFISQHIVNITPDACIKYFRINGAIVNIDNLVHGENCDPINGFDIDLGKYLHHGNNTFEIGLIALTGDGEWLGLSIKNSYSDKLYLFLIDTLTLEIIMLLYFFLKDHLQLPQEIVIVIALGILLRIVYLSYTPYNERTYDVLEYGGHLDYIKYVANHFQLPEPKDGWEYFQAPLYYITAAVVYKISSNLALDYQSLLQIISLIYFTIFLIFGVLILQIICKSKVLFFSSTALLTFWPSGIIHSIRVGNDPMYYMVFVIAVYFLMRWLANKQSKHFYLASLFTALTIATKLNGVLVLGIFGIVFVSTWLKTMQKRKYLIKIIFLISIVLLASYVSLFRSVRTVLQDHHFNVLVGNISELNSELSVKNNLNNYLYFDANIYFTKPFTNTWTDEGGRQYFWNFFLKSMLFGEFSFPSFAAQSLATILSLVLLQMFFFFFVGFLLSIRNLSPLHLFVLLWFVLSLLSLISYRHTYPFSSNGDFRFIFPAIIPFIYFYITGINFFIESKLLIIGILEYILCYLFIATICVFFIIPLVA